jgi:HlyD family type I secretion membrane fusion protein
MMMQTSGGAPLSAAQAQRAQTERLAQAIPIVTEDARGVIRLGYIVLFLFFIVLGGWLAVAPLASASISMGTVKVEAQRQAVQHLEGGIVKEILVRDGKRVEEGDVLIRLDDAQARANYDVSYSQFMALKAVEARLIAEREDATVLRFGPELVAAQTDPTVAQIMAAQQQLFTARRDTLLNQEQVLRQRILQSQEQIRAAQAQETSQRQQLALIRDELQGTRELFERGYAPRTRVLALERTAAALVGQQAEYAGSVGRLRQQIGENEVQIQQLRRDRLQEIADQLRDTATRLGDAEPRLRAARDSLERIVIKAPMSGVVVGMTTFTVGGVINRSERLMDIVPVDSPLIVEAQVVITDADNIRADMKAELHLSSMKRGSTIPIVKGWVRTVSADRLVDQQTGMPYYLARIEVDKDSLASQKDITLIPGMPVDVIIPLNERTALTYLIQPFLQGIDRAGREQ